ncbi:hypothetical protein M407DRAFT_136165 [Tulasnella calospora MUT 4182]|uniref:Uncharacterized protein n=1 Tax=Tulasnella calospora MUT 4182 TaxID=1051891 RepID=A0A0C3MCA2_9AGAM|nr:hypothetical protein M407DRAFT_136165 [Tulasnella calospora MUT 4182]
MRIVMITMLFLHLHMPSCFTLCFYGFFFVGVERGCYLPKHRAFESQQASRYG